jgi:hypothetical protein
MPQLKSNMSELITQIKKQIEEKGTDSDAETREAFRREARVKRFGSKPSVLITLIDKGKGKAKSRQLEVNVSNPKIHFRIDGNDNLIFIDLTITDNNKIIVIITDMQDFESDLQANPVRDWYKTIRNMSYYIVELTEKVKKTE